MWFEGMQLGQGSAIDNSDNQESSESSKAGAAIVLSRSSLLKHVMCTVGGQILTFHVFQPRLQLMDGADTIITSQLGPPLSSLGTYGTTYGLMTD
jgi:hypothetical protein